MKKATSLLLVLFLALAFFSCAEPVTGLWSDALYNDNTALGDGAVEFTLKVTAEQKTVVFTVKTDKENLEQALTELGIISGEQGAYGLYIKTVNGMRADYERDGLYWAFYDGGEMSLSGVSGTAVKNGGEYELKAEK